MANWTKRTPSGSTNRRKWNLEGKEKIHFIANANNPKALIKIAFNLIDRASLNNLKYHFAADGCSDIQYDLARQLLENNSELDEESSHIQGVHWLLRATQQGHEEALEMLRECYKNKRGITDTNEVEVKACLSMTPGERAARKAARELFACLSNGGEHITPAQLERKMREIYNIQKKKRHRNDIGDSVASSSSSTSTGATNEAESSSSTTAAATTTRATTTKNGYIYPSKEHLAAGDSTLPEQNVITEANLVTAAVNYSHGRLPSVNEILTLSVPHPNVLDNVPCFHRLIFHPLVFFTLLYHRFINVISSFPGTTTSNLKLLFLFLIYALISSDNRVILLPMTVYYFSLSVMIWSTFKMLKTKHEFIDFRIWSGLFLSYGDNIDARGSENQFLRNNMRPYLYFFCAFIINLIMYPVISNEWMPHSEITMISFVLVFLTMIAFMYTSPPPPFPDILILFSFGINVLAKYPYEMDSVVTTGWRFLDLKVPTFCSFVIGNGIEFCLNCRAVLYLLIPIFLIQLAKRSNWHGAYAYLIPHCVTLSWLQICIVSSKYATMFGLVRAALGLAGILLFLPLFGIVTLMIPIFVTIEWLGLSDPKIRLLTSLLAASFAVLGSCLMALNRKTQKYVTALQITVCIIAAVLLILPYMTSNFKISHSDSTIYDNILRRKPDLLTPEDVTPEHTISWESFYKRCDYPAWEHVNKIRTQLRCSQLEGTFVTWEGTVSTVQITKVSNFRATVIKNYLPNWLGNLILCYYGDKDHFDCDSGEKDCEEFKQFFDDNKTCNLNKWNSYEYEIKVRMHSGILSRPGEVYLKASHHFGNFTKNLIISDRIWFKGRLMNSRKINERQQYDMVLGSGKPVIDLLALGCTTCHNKDLISAQIPDNHKFAVSARMRDLMRGIKYLLNVLFNPLLTFK